MLRTELAGFPPRAWVVRTGLAAAIAWAIGLAPALLGRRLTAWPWWW